MTVTIEKTAKAVIEIPDDYVKDFFGGNLNETDFIRWVDSNVCIDRIHEIEELDEKLDVWVMGETTKSIEIEDCPKELKSSYSEEEINNVQEAIENAERCYECTGYGDDYYTDPETGELISSCETCPFNSNNS